MTAGLPLMKNILMPLAIGVLMPLGLTAAASTDAAIRKKNLGSGMTTLIFFNEELDAIMKIVKSLEDVGLFIKVVIETVENEVKEQRGGYLGMLAATLGASLLGRMVSGKGVIWADEGRNFDQNF